MEQTRNVLKKRILYLASKMPNPVMSAHIDLLRQAGFQVEILAFDRIFSPTHSEAAIILGRVQDRGYLKRLPTLLGALPKIRAAIRRSQLIYAFNADMAFLGLLAGLGLGRPIVINVMYLQPIQTASGLPGKLMRTIDRFVIGRCRLLTLNSPGLFHYFYDWLKTRRPSLVIEMKVESARAKGSMPKNGLPLLDRPLVIGWFGILRHTWSLEFLERLNQLSNGRFKIVLAGIVPSRRRGDFDSLLHRNSDIKFCGSFHPGDLPHLYGNVDMVWACLSPFPPESWHRSTRYYEACFFQKPLIVRPGEDAREVEKRQIGLVLDEDSPAAAARKFSVITSDDWRRWRANMAALPRRHYMFTDESSKLSGALDEVLNRRGG